MQILQPVSVLSYSGVSQTFKFVASTEGLKALWRGINSVALGAGPAHAIYFATYEKSKEFLGARFPEPSHGLIVAGWSSFVLR